MKRVLITGMSGLIGRLLRRHLEQRGGYHLTALNRRSVEGVESVQADISDLQSIVPAFQGQEVVVHLAASLGFTDWEQALSANIVGAYNVYEAARLAGVKRVVFASSGSTVRGIERIPPYDALTTGRYGEVPEQFAKVTHEAVQPTDIYGASKVWGEAIGRYFSDAHGLSVLCVRIGWVGQDDHPKTPRQVSLYLSHRDVLQILERCIEAPPELAYDIFFATSNNRWGYRDLGHARQVLGYEPQDSAEAFGELAPTPPE
jgi:nucleoside-diphosphate-sugar epimerase